MSKSVELNKVVGTIKIRYKEEEEKGRRRKKKRRREEEEEEKKKRDANLRILKLITTSFGKYRSSTMYLNISIFPAGMHPIITMQSSPGLGHYSQLIPPRPQTTY